MAEVAAAAGCEYFYSFDESLSPFCQSMVEDNFLGAAMSRRCRRRANGQTVQH